MDTNETQTDQIMIPGTNLSAREYLQHALHHCLGLHWAFTPLTGKRPLRKGWQNEPPLSEELLLDHQGNIGLRTGVISGLVIVDIDAGADLTGLDLPETVEVQTGSGGRHLYYAYDKPLRNSASKIGKHIDIRGDGGQCVFAGSIHQATGAPYVFTKAPWDVQLAPLPGWIVEITDLPAEKRATPPPPAAKPTPAGHKPAHGYGATALRLEIQALRDASNGTRNDSLNRSAFAMGQLVGAGELERGYVESELMAAAMMLGLSEHETLATIESGLEAGIAEPRKIEKKSVGRLASLGAEIGDTSAATPEPGATLDCIITPGSHVDDRNVIIKQSTDTFSKQVLDALPEDLIYLKSQLPGEIIGDPGARRWAELSTDRARILIDRHTELCAWAKTKQDDHILVFKACNRDWAGLTLAGAAHHPHARELKMLVTYPLYGRDWQITKPGWNDGGYYYDEPEELRDMKPERDVETIYTTLSELITDFPFADEASRQNFFGLLLTPIITPAIDGNRPLHLIGASLERTGKSKLAEQVFGGVIMGKPTPALQITDNEDEQDKRILSLLLQSGTLVHLDNLPSAMLDSRALASFLTTRVYSGRLLSSSKMLNLENVLTVVATGNNIQCSSEIAKRIIPIILQPKTSHPEDRTEFEHCDLPRHVRENRRLILSCLLGMIENWKAAGQPPHPQPLGGFESWAAAVGGILNVNFMPSWRKNEKTWRGKSDSQTEELLTFVTAWWERAKTANMSIIELLKIADDVEVFDWIFNRPQERARQTAMGKLMRRYIDTPIGKWIIKRHGIGTHNSYCLCENKMSVRERQ